MMMQDEQPMEEQAEDEMEVRYPEKTTKMMAASFDQISFSTIGASLAVIQLDRSIQIVWLT